LSPGFFIIRQDCLKIYPKIKQPTRHNVHKILPQDFSNAKSSEPSTVPHAFEAAED
jgi:hypothetical protein